uniref:Uncharacterized protein n=1 Tax=Osugoroshi virus TaxID=2202814 RepID=A0A7R7T1P4_9VIRU|nr:hypothetical protein [Osugoroshi virus]
MDDILVRLHDMGFDPQHDEDSFYRLRPDASHLHFGYVQHYMPGRTYSFTPPDISIHIPDESGPRAPAYFENILESEESLKDESTFIDEPEPQIPVSAWPIIGASLIWKFRDFPPVLNSDGFQKLVRRLLFPPLQSPLSHKYSAHYREPTVDFYATTGFLLIRMVEYQH